MKKLLPNSEIFTRAVERIITPEGLKEKLKSGKKLRIKFGVDVTAPTLHIGNAVNLWKMRELQECGHQIIFLIGDFTTKIGDPTGRLEARKGVGAKDIDKWAGNFLKEIGKILLTEKDVFEVRRNSEWFGSMKTEKLLELLSFFTHAGIIERDMFQRRIREGKEIRIPELIYPILQGYDSVMLESDLTIIGSDQLFNENIGRFLQEKFSQSPQVVITTVITPGLDGGPKMSKSLGNYIGLDDSPTDKFGKAMRVLDPLIVPYLEVYTDVPLSGVAKIKRDLSGEKNPMEAKLFFAEALVKRYHGAKTARAERDKFQKVFSRREIPEDVSKIKLRHGFWDPVVLLIEARLAPSKSEARRLLKQGAVEVGGVLVKDPQEKIEAKKDMIIRVGKRRMIKII